MLPLCRATYKLSLEQLNSWGHNLLLLVSLFGLVCVAAAVAVVAAVGQTDRP